MKANADNNSSVVQMMQLVLGRVTKTEIQKENAGYKHFLLFP